MNKIKKLVANVGLAAYLALAPMGIVNGGDVNNEGDIANPKKIVQIDNSKVNRTESLEEKLNCIVTIKDDTNYAGVNVKSEFYKYPDAKKLLVVLGQNHGFINHLQDFKDIKLPEGRKLLRSITEDSIRETNESQKGIYKILYNLNKNMNVNSVFAEGVIKDITDPKESNFIYTRGAFEIIRNGYFKEDYKNGKVDNFAFAPGGVFLLGKSGKIDILAAEDSYLNGRAVAASKIDGPKGVRKFSERRENYALEKITSRDGNIKVLVYGNDHNFRNNIAEWNSKNLNDQYSLMKLTPKYKKRINFK